MNLEIESKRMFTWKIINILVNMVHFVYHFKRETHLIYVFVFVIYDEKKGIESVTITTEYRSIQRI